ncbi:MAG: hypothetical protein ACOCR6_02060 [archaeon]
MVDATGHYHHLFCREFTPVIPEHGDGRHAPVVIRSLALLVVQ